MFHNIHLHPEDPRKHYWKLKGFWLKLAYTQQVAEVVKPQTILEIGVYAGYAAQALLLGAPDAYDIGLDCNDE